MAFLSPKCPSQHSTIWSVASKTVRGTATFTAMTVTNQCVTNAGMNIRGVQKQRTMKWCFSCNANYDFQWRSAGIIPQGILTFSVTNAVCLYAPNVPQCQFTRNIPLPTWRQFIQKKLRQIERKSLNFKNTSCQLRKSCKRI